MGKRSSWMRAASLLAWTTHRLPWSEYPSYQARSFAEEHALFDVDDRCKLTLGDTVELVPGYAPTTVNLYDVYHVVENGVVVDIWPIIPRGPGTRVGRFRLRRGVPAMNMFEGLSSKLERVRARRGRGVS